MTSVADSGTRPSPTLTSGPAEALVTAGQQLPYQEDVQFILGHSRCSTGRVCMCCSMFCSRQARALLLGPDPVPPGGVSVGARLAAAMASLATGSSRLWLIWF